MSCKVLVVEDDPGTRNLIVAGLGQRGYGVKAVESAELGLEARKFEPYDVLLVDFMLPEKNGVDFVREVRKADDKVGIVMMTSLQPDKLSESIEGLGVWAVVEKPFDLDCLEEKVKEACELAHLPDDKSEEISRQFDMETTKLRSLGEDICNESSVFPPLEIPELPHLK